MSKFAKIFVPLVAVGGLGAAAFYFSNHGGIGGHNVMDLARNTPQKAFFWAAAEMREEASPARLNQQIAKAKTDYKGFNDFCAEFEKDTGKKLEDLVKIYAASGSVALYVAGGKEFIAAPVGAESPIDVVFESQLYDPKAADEMMTKVREKATNQTVAGQTVYINKEICLSIAGDFLLVTNNKATMEKAIHAALQHKGTLADEEQFKLALSKVPDLKHGNGSAFYLDLNPLWTSIEKAPRVGQYTDADTFKGLRSLPYAIGGATIQGGKWTGQGFLAVNAKSETELAKALLKKPGSAHELAAALPESWGIFQGFDTYYTYELLQAIVRLAPMGRMGLAIGLSRVGLGANGNRELQIRKAFNGQTAWAVDMNSVSRAGAQGSQNVPSEKVLGTLILGVKDAAAAKELLAQLGSWEKVEIAGKEAFQLKQPGAQLFYLMLDKPAAMAFGFGPKAREALTAVADASSGKTTALARRATFSSFAGKYTKDSAAISFLDFKILFEQLEKETLESNDPDKAVAQQMLALVKGHLSDDLASIQVEADGLRYTNEGAAGAIGMVGALTMPILVPNFMKARGQGQLTACKSNEKNIATALEMYASDNGGKYPADLKPLTTGNYLRTIPTCPSASRDTYSESYRMQTAPDVFSFYCSGLNHSPMLPANLPGYNAERGLIDRP